MSYTKEQARAEIAHLVAHFRANEPSLVNVPEAQIEDNYIRKLFHFLNWNTDNTGLSVAEWEFVLQRTDEKGKRPDYLLQLDGQQVLVMDAKKVKYDMHDPRWITQVYAYAYSTQSQPASRKIDFAILTDFQEFILLDCTLYAADLRAVSNFRILDWTYEDYVSQFDTLWELLERENVRAAIHTRDTQKPSGLWSRYLSPKKVKANRIPPDKTFLVEMDDENTGWRVRLAKDMKKRNPDADGALITAAVQLLIDRLIFVKVLSDREIEADYLIQLAEQVEKSGLAADDAGWFNACRDIFARLNQFYNGSIFEPRPELEAVTVSNKVVRGVIRDLQPENSPYNFAVLPVEILGTIYERFLGRVVRATDQRVKIEDKPEVRKAGGVYYTPQYIVDYIVENTVGKLLSECKTPADAAKLCILDPACGSGSFLLGAYAALIRWHETYYSDQQRLTQRDREAAYYDSDGRVRLTAKLKRQILLNNLFGVDIDAQAVEVTRFSLSLKALEDTRRAELYEEVTLFKQTVLPDLRHNIKCGNSLIGPDYFSGQMFADKDELLRVKPFDWAQEFPEVMAAGSFDAVIGNPPYIRARIFKEFYPKEAEYFGSKYECATHVWDIYLLFFEKTVELLKQGGRASFIIPIQTLHQPNCESLRRLLLSKTSIVSIADLSQLRVFQDAIVKNCIFVTEKFLYDKNIINIFYPTNPNELFGKPIRTWPQSSIAQNPSLSMKIDLMSPKKLLCEKLESKSWRLDELCYVTFGLRSCAKGVGQGGKDRLISNNKNAPNAKPYLEGRDIKRFATYPTGRFLKYIPSEMYSPRVPELFETKKIVSQSMLSKMRLIATLDLDKYYVEQSLVCIIPHGIITETITQDAVPLQFILGILNSQLESFYFGTSIIDHSLGGGLIHATPGSQSKLIIPKASKTQIDSMISLVESMLALHKHKAAARTQAEQEQFQRQIDATDRQIDALVYELYRLTSDEIAIVKGQT